MWIAKAVTWGKSSIMELILFALCAILAFEADGFFSVDNLLNVLRNVSMQGIIAFGMTMVIISGEIDLSVGSAVAFAGCLTAYLTESLAATGLGLGASVALAMLGSLLTGFAVGALSGFIRVRFGVPTFIDRVGAVADRWVSADALSRMVQFFGRRLSLGDPFPSDRLRTGISVDAFPDGVYDVGPVDLCGGRQRRGGAFERYRCCSGQGRGDGGGGVFGGAGRYYAIGRDHVGRGDDGQRLGIGCHCRGDYRRHQPDGWRRQDSRHLDRCGLFRDFGQRHDTDEY